MWGRLRQGRSRGGVRKAGSEFRQPRGGKGPGLVLMETSPDHFSPSFIPCTPDIELLGIKGRQGKVPALGCLTYWGFTD